MSSHTIKLSGNPFIGDLPFDAQKLSLLPLLSVVSRGPHKILDVNSSVLTISLIDT